MVFPNLFEEKKLWQEGFDCVVGLDEAGRGPLAGPVVAAAVFVKPEIKKLNIFKGMRDSKKLSALQREKFYKILIASKYIEWGIGIVSEKVIDKINILEATKLAMEKAICDANMRMHANDTNKINYLLLDGNFKINSIVRQKSIVSGDEKVFSCCAAGIIAKVTRDRIMQKMDKKYPQYGFKRHKGYGTKAHFANLKKFGACKIHRKSFYPVSAI